MRRPSRLEILLLVAASILFLAGAYVTQSYREARAELDLLSHRVAAREADALSAQQATQLIEPMKAELARLEAELASPPKVHFPKDASTVALVDLAASAGRQSGAQLLSFQRMGAVSAKLAGHDYMMHRYEVKARGQLSQLSRFISDMEAGPLSTMVIEVGSLSAGQNAWEMTVSIAYFTQTESD